MIKERHKVIPTSHLFLIKNNKILLLRRFNTGYEDGNYGVVAGHVDKGESFTQCMTREAEEEAGVILEPENLKVAHIMHRNCGEDNERVDAFFIAEKWDGKIEIKEPDKCDDLSWFDLDNLPNNVIPYIKQAIDCIRNKTFYSEREYNIKI